MHNLVLTCTKNEGPFILEWVAYHVSIGFDHFLTYTGESDDRTDAIWDRLGDMGLATHRNNGSGKAGDLSSPARPYQTAVQETAYQNAAWVAVLDPDEFLNLHVGDKSLQALLAEVPEAKCISLRRRLFGSSDRSSFHDSFLTASLRRAASAEGLKPAQAWGMKSLFKPEAVKTIGAHRPKAVQSTWDDLGWVSGAGEPMPDEYFQGGWRMTPETGSYKLGQINHYAVRTRESFLVKRLQDASRNGPPDATYWNRMNRNERYDDTILPALPAAQAIFEELLEDPILGDLHGEAVECHQAEIARLRATPEGDALFRAILPTMFGRAA